MCIRDSLLTVQHHVAERRCFPTEAPQRAIHARWRGSDVSPKLLKGSKGMRVAMLRHFGEAQVGIVKSAAFHGLFGFGRGRVEYRVQNMDLPSGSQEGLGSLNGPCCVHEMVETRSEDDHVEPVCGQIHIKWIRTREYWTVSEHPNRLL